MREKQRLTVEFFSDYMDDSLDPALTLLLEIKSRFIEVYSASFRIHANFSGLRSLMFYYPITSAILGTMVNFALLTLLLLVSYLRFFGPPIERKLMEDDTEEEDQDLIQDEEESTEDQQEIIEEVKTDFFKKVD